MAIMRLKRLPNDFRVEEIIDLPEREGPYAYYRVEKRGITTIGVRDALAEKFNVTSSHVVFPALKGKGAVTVQYASIRKKGAELFRDKRFVARRVRWGPRALRPGDLRGNRFRIIVRDLDETQAAALGPELLHLGEVGLPNYFDDQRFGSLSPDGFIGKSILMRDSEEVVRLYLSSPMAGDTREVRAFKRLVASHWGQWGYLLHQAPRPSNYRSVLTFLKDHPQLYRKAANLIHDRLLSVYLVAYQSWVWNQILGTYLAGRVGEASVFSIARRALPAPREFPPELRNFELQMPNLTALYPPEFMPVVEKVLAEEAMSLEDFKARILRRVYLPKGKRAVWFKPEEVTCDPPAPDQIYAGRWAVQVNFMLGPGRYATLVLKALAAHLGAELRVR